MWLTYSELMETPAEFIEILQARWIAESKHEAAENERMKAKLKK